MMLLRQETRNRYRAQKGAALEYCSGLAIRGGQNLLRNDDATDHDVFDLGSVVSPRIQRESDAGVPSFLYRRKPFGKKVGYAIGVDQPLQHFVLQDCSPSGVSSAALGHGRIVQKRSVHSVNAGSARGGPSLAGTGCDAVSEIEAQLPGHRPEVSTDVLGSAETQARVRAYAHELRSRHVCHGGLHGQAGESPPLRCASIAHRRPLRPSLSAGDHGRPVTALRRIVGDSYRGWKVGGVSS